MPETAVECHRYRADGRDPAPLDLAAAVRASTAGDGFVWVALQAPAETELADVAERFALPHLAVEDARKAHQRPKIEVYGDVIFIVLKPVRYREQHEVLEVDEVAMFLGETFVVTVRHGETDVLATVRHDLDGEDGRLDQGAVAVLYRAADVIVDGYEEAVDAINDDVDEIEIQVFGDGEQGHAERIYKLKREIAQLRRAIVPLANPFQRLVEANIPPVDESITPFFRDIYDHLLRAIDAVEGQDRLLSDVLQADLARLSVRQAEIAGRQNDDMRKISAWAAIGLLPTAVAGIYGMNFEHMPELGTRYGYFVVVALIALSCFVLYRQFRHRGWL